MSSKKEHEQSENWQQLKDHFKNVVINDEGKLDQTTAQIIKIIENGLGSSLSS